jgi:hypothetical protein
MSKKKSTTFFTIHYRDPKDGSAVSIKAKSIQDSSLGLSFVCISDFVFDSSSILVNPDEEARKLEFENVKSLHLSIYSILSITEVGEHKKPLEFKNDKSNLLVLSQEPSGSPSN